MERIHSPIGTHSWNKKGYNYKYDRAVEEHMYIKEDKKNHKPDDDWSKRSARWFESVDERVLEIIFKNIVKNNCIIWLMEVLIGGKFDVLQGSSKLKSAKLGLRRLYREGITPLSLSRAIIRLSFWFNSGVYGSPSREGSGKGEGIPLKVCISTFSRFLNTCKDHQHSRCAWNNIW